MSLIKSTIEQYKVTSKDNGTQDTVSTWTSIREYEIDKLGGIHPETGTFFTDEGGMAIDWNRGEHNLEVLRDGSAVAYFASAFGVTERRLTSWDQIESELDRIFNEL